MGKRGAETASGPLVGAARPHLDAILAGADQRRPDVGGRQYLRSWQRAVGNLRTVRAALGEARP